MEVEGARSRGKPRKTWLEVVKNDMMELSQDQDRHAWKRKIGGTQVCLERAIKRCVLSKN